MSRSRPIRYFALNFLAFAVLTRPAEAGTIAAESLPLPNRVASADVIVLGKVTALEDKTVAAASYPGAKDKVDFTVAVVTVGEMLTAPKGAKTIRLAFVPTPPMVRISPAPLQPAVGMEGCFFLTKLGEVDLLLAPGQLQFIDKNSPTFEKDFALIQRCAKILEDPNAALKGKDAEDRFLAAGMLVAQYRSRKSSNPKVESIDAEQSKLILQALAAADWTPSRNFLTLSPLMVLLRLPLTDKDGWMPPANREPKEFAAYAQQWVKEHAESYRIQRFVPE